VPAPVVTPQPAPVSPKKTVVAPVQVVAAAEKKPEVKPTS